MVHVGQTALALFEPADPFLGDGGASRGIHHIALGAQDPAAAARALRGMKDNIMPLWIAGFGYWVLGIGGGAVLAFHYDMQGDGLWWGLAAGLAVAGCLLTLRFDRFTRARAADLAGQP